MTRISAMALGLALVAAPSVLAPTPAAAQAMPLEAGAVAPDFSLPGATRHGVLAEQVSLSDYAGKTVVLAFFFRARSRG